MTDDVTRQRRIEIAQTIRAQLGGLAFELMTGARHFSALDSGLSFMFPFPVGQPRRVNGCRIILTPMDTYTMEFVKATKKGIETVETCEDIYAENLAQCFRRVTGLETRMPKIVAA